MSSTLNIPELTNYAAGISDAELLEDISHLVDLNIVTRAISATDNGYSSKLPLATVAKVKDAFKIYRDELASRVFNSDVEHDTRLILLGEYYTCVKTVRSLSKYLDRTTPTVSRDSNRPYSELLNNRKKSDFNQLSLQGGEL